MVEELDKRAPPPEVPGQEALRAAHCLSCHPVTALRDHRDRNPEPLAGTSWLHRLGISIVIFQDISAQGKQQLGAKGEEAAHRGSLASWDRQGATGRPVLALEAGHRVEVAPVYSV
jgi:hypothetical protein